MNKKPDHFIVGWTDKFGHRHYEQYTNAYFAFSAALQEQSNRENSNISINAYNADGSVLAVLVEGES
jgi:hypothetical protein